MVTDSGGGQQAQLDACPAGEGPGEPKDHPHKCDLGGVEVPASWVLPVLALLLSVTSARGRGIP